ncbi:MAG TPA: NAD/FAD-dependent oxidoreductase [Opitutae bacterium]|nr:NAD/FAD-dependent oxidoreductase [Opitutae bacterium]
METIENLVIGAGISGLLCASELSRAGREVVVLDKGRGLGGRMATRRMAGARIDHGAQFFTVRDARFQKYVDEWLDAGIIREWFSHSAEDSSSEGHPRYCGVTGMTDVAKYLAADLKVHRSERVVALARDIDLWVAKTDSGKVFTAKHLVMTAPLPQSLLLLDSTGLDYAADQLSELRSVTYEKGLAALVLLDGPSGLDEPGGLKVDEGPLTWIADNSMKGISPDVSALTLHANAEFAETHWDSPDGVRGQLMIDAARNYIRSNVLEFSCHRWGFTLPVNPLQQSFFSNHHLKLMLAGDAFGGPRIEGSALSGLAAAARLL